MENTSQQTLLMLTNITKDFPGTRALDDVTFDLFAGEVHCLVGENGAGKSTLIKILSGAEKPDKGKIAIFDREYTALDPKESIRQGISTIYQDVDLVQTLSVTDNIYLGDEIRNTYGFIDSRKQEEKAQAIMDMLNLKIDVRRLVEDLSPAQKQTLQIVKALHREAKVLVMDEPTSSLGQEETMALMELITSLTAQGIGIIYISHYIDEVFKIGDRITVLKDGKKVSTYKRAQCDIDTIIRDMVGREAAVFYNKERVPIGPTVLQVRNYTRANSVRDVSFDVRQGEIFGIGGMVGSGRTELVNLLFGVDHREQGKMFLKDREITPRTPTEAIRRGICMIVEDRKNDGLFSIRSVKENISVVHIEKSGFMINLPAERDLVNQMVSKLKIRTSNTEQDISSLSGGNQQKSILARWLLSNAAVFIFDEPTKGVDIGSKEEIYKFMTELARHGKAIIMISSDMPELLSMSDRIGIMRNGAMVTILPAKQATEERMLKEFLGLTVRN